MPSLTQYIYLTVTRGRDRSRRFGVAPPTSTSNFIYSLSPDCPSVFPLHAPHSHTVINTGCLHILRSTLHHKRYRTLRTDLICVRPWLHICAKSSSNLHPNNRSDPTSSAQATIKKMNYPDHNLSGPHYRRQCQIKCSRSLSTLA